jgi:hypothetical protein
LKDTNGEFRRDHLSVVTVRKLYAPSAAPLFSLRCSGLFSPDPLRANFDSLPSFLSVPAALARSSLLLMHPFAARS